MPGLSTEAHRLAAVAALVIIYWITEALPLPVTALLGMALIIVTGVAPPEDVFPALGNQVIFLFIGSFILARSMQIHHLDRRIAYSLLAHPWVGKSTYRTIWTVGLTSWILSMWISNTATVAMLFPVALAIAHTSAQTLQAEAGEQPGTGRRYTTGLLLMVAYSGSVGGLATPIGTPPNLIGIALIEEGLGRDIQFLEWMVFGLPPAMILLCLIFGIVLLLFRPTVREVPGQIEMMRANRQALGAWSAGERNSLIAFGTAIFLWVLPGILDLLLGTEHPLAVSVDTHIPEGVAAIEAATLLFILPVDWKQREFTLRWEDAVGIDWGTVLLFAGGIALGQSLFNTGLAEVLGTNLVNLLGTEPAVIRGTAVGVASIISETSSNTASVNIITPVMMAATGFGEGSLIVAVAATLGASMGFMLPVSTPPNAIVYGSGEIRILDMVKAGLLLDLIGVVIVWLSSLWLLPLVLGSG